MNEQVKHKGEGHRKRLRERFLKDGLSGFQDYEVLELLLTLNTPRKDCKSPAKELLKQFKTLHGVFEATPLELSKVNGIGPANQFGIKLVKEIATRYQENKITETDVVSNSNDLIDYLNIAIRDRRKECFTAVFLNAKNKVITTKILFEGSLTSSSVYPREVVQEALNNKAASVIFAHNHPSGEPEPSTEDILITRQLVFACRVMGINVHEHLIIGTTGYYSFADHGYILQFKQEFDKRDLQN